MASITATQYEQCRCLLSDAIQWLRNDKPQTINGNSNAIETRSTSVVRAFHVVEGCCVPIFLGMRFVVHYATWHFNEQWALGKVPQAQWPNLWVFGGKEGIQERVGMSAAQHFYPWVCFRVVNPSLRQWWTPLTAAFTHVDPGHFGRSMTALWALQDICARVPGLDGVGVAIVTVLSGVCQNLAVWGFDMLQNSRVGAPPVESHAHMYSWGASGIVAAFLAIATLASPRAPIRAGDIPIPTPSVPVWALALWWFSGDVARVSKIVLPQAIIPHNFSKPDWISGGHVAHLTGALIGVAYYYLVLHRAQGRSAGTTPASQALQESSRDKKGTEFAASSSRDRAPTKDFNLATNEAEEKPLGGRGLFLQRLSQRLKDENSNEILTAVGLILWRCL